MEKHPKDCQNLVLRSREDFRDTDNPGKQRIKVAATCELGGNARSYPAAILYPSIHKACILVTRVTVSYI